MSDPKNAIDYYFNMQSIWLDSTYLFYGGQGHPGHGGYGPDTRFMFPGESDSLNWGPGCQLPNGPVNWTSRLTGNTPGDIRGIGATGPFTFHPGDVQELDIAFIFARDYTGQDTLDPSLEKLRQMIDIVRNSYNTGLLPNGHSFFGINDQSQIYSPKIKIYPNPANDKINISFDRPVNEKFWVQIINTSGMTVYSCSVKPTRKIMELDVSELSSGIYIINIQTKDFITNKKVIIIK